MTGVSAIQYYSVKIYGQIGISGSDALKYQAINNIIALVGEALCILLIDKLGRRRPLIIGNLCNMVLLSFYVFISMHVNRSCLLGLLPYCLYIDCQVPARDKQQHFRVLGFHYHVSSSHKVFHNHLTTPGLGYTTSPSQQPVVPYLGLFPPRSLTPALAPREFPSQP